MGYNLVEQNWVATQDNEEVLITTSTPFTTLVEAQAQLNTVKTALGNNNILYLAKIFSNNELIQAFRYILLEDFNIS
jgi:hypothetical protein